MGIFSLGFFSTNGREEMWHPTWAGRRDHRRTGWKGPAHEDATGMGVVSMLGLAGAGCITSIHWRGCGGLQGAEVGCFCEGLQGTTTMFHSRVDGTPLGPHSPIPRLWQDQTES